MILSNLLTARGWFAGFLVIMIVITLLFVFIVLITLKPIKKEDMGGDTSAAKRLLGRKEAELANELLKNKDNRAKSAELEAKLREVAIAEKVLDEIAAENKAAVAAAEEQEKREKIAKGNAKKEQKPKAKPTPDSNAEKKAADEVAATKKEDKADKEKKD